MGTVAWRMAVNGWRALGVAVAVLVKLAHGPGAVLICFQEESLSLFWFLVWWYLSIFFRWVVQPPTSHCWKEPKGSMGTIVYLPTFTITTWWQLKYFWNVHPDPCGFMIQFDEHYFSDGLVQPPTRYWMFILWIHKIDGFLKMSKMSQIYRCKMWIER